MCVRVRVWLCVRVGIERSGTMVPQAACLKVYKRCP